MEGDEVQTFGIEPKIWTMTSTTMSLAEKKSKFREMELKHEVNNIITFEITFHKRKQVSLHNGHLNLRFINLRTF